MLHHVVGIKISNLLRIENFGMEGALKHSDSQMLALALNFKDLAFIFIGLIVHLYLNSSKRLVTCFVNQG